jgi:hypothetical protein
MIFILSLYAHIIIDWALITRTTSLDTLGRRSLRGVMGRSGIFGKEPRSWWRNSV